MTVFVVDDDPSVRKALARLLRSAHHNVETFPSADAFLAAGRSAHTPACLVLDVRMPGLNGIDLQKRLRSLDPALAIIFITGHGDIPMSVQAMKAGAVDFLPKPFEDTDFLEAVERALAKNLRETQARAELTSIQERLATLTPREREVMALVVTGLLNKQIAAELGTVEKTIKVHRARVMDKMQVLSVAELSRLAHIAGINSPG